jgi:hypothetical protein
VGGMGHHEAGLICVGRPFADIGALELTGKQADDWIPCYGGHLYLYVLRCFESLRIVTTVNVTFHVGCIGSEYEQSLESLINRLAIR